MSYEKLLARTSKWEAKLLEVMQEPVLPSVFIKNLGKDMSYRMMALSLAARKVKCDELQKYLSD